MILPPNAPRLYPIDPKVQANLDWMWQAIRTALLVPQVLVDTAAHQTNYAATSYAEGTIYFASDTHNLYVDSYSTGTPTWTLIA